MYTLEAHEVLKTLLVPTKLHTAGDFNSLFDTATDKILTGSYTFHSNILFRDDISQATALRVTFPNPCKNSSCKIYLV